MSYYGDLRKEWDDCWDWCSKYTDEQLRKKLKQNKDKYEIEGHSRAFIEGYLDRYKPNRFTRYTDDAW
jgi:hypothetical protein